MQHPCVLSEPPERGLLDRFALLMEGRGIGHPTDTLLDLAQVLSSEQFASLDPQVASFYHHPTRYILCVSAKMGRWSRFLMVIFAGLFRQSDVCHTSVQQASSEVCQRLYVDGRGRSHWDRYLRVGVGLHRLFVARMTGQVGSVTETFVFYGLPVRLGFDAEVKSRALRLTLNRGRSSWAAWPASVQYSTAGVGDGALQTRGEFRVWCLGLRVEMNFSMVAL